MRNNPIERYEAVGTNMRVWRKSIVGDGSETFMDLPITAGQIEDFNRGMMVQDAFQNLSDGEREFLLSGITPDKWSEMFGHDDEGDECDDE